MPRLSKIGAAAAAAFGITGTSSVSANYLQVAGGGAGGGAGGNVGGGGGAGGYLTGTLSLNPALSYTVVVGAGGAGSTVALGTSGSNSQFGTLTASVGGGGGGATSGTSGANGGSGGGCGYSGGSPGSGTAGQGNAGAAGNGTNYGTGGGGGGAGSAGVAGGGTTGGNGGDGLASSISGTSLYYAGGGGGAVAYTGTVYGSGGSGVGGNGAASGGGAATAGLANRGGGGGGASAAFTTSGSGGSGVVIISYAAPQQFGGGIVTTSGSNVIHTFTTSGTLTPISSLSASYLIVAGGGGGGGAVANASGGGGAGGLISGSGTTIDTNSNYVVTVGAGGASGGAGSNGGTGGTSSFSIISNIANGGGYGAGGGGAAGQSVTNASGGGGSAPNSGSGTGGTGTVYGNNGGAGSSGSGSSGAGGGGGGAGGAGSAGSGSTAGSGGAGSTSSISGTSTTYAAGGAGAGGSSGAGASGTSNTGNGGVGGAPSSNAGGAGGSGIVIISYAGSVQQMAGGTVTISGGNVIHTFTSSGYLTPLKFVGNSLRFRSSSNGFLNRTPTTSGTSDQKMTLSVWVKRSIFGVSQTIIGSQNSSPGGNEAQLLFNTDNLRFYTNGGSTNPALITNATYRDPAAWYHIVLSCDTTQAIASNRFLMYVNGVQVTSFSTATYPSQNASIGWNVPYQFKIGQFSNTNEQFDGYMAEFNYIDGQGLTPNSFGTFNSYGVWQPITYGGSYGTNGFYLPFNKPTASTYAGSFNGTSQYLNFTGNSSLQLGTGSFTIEAWVYGPTQLAYAGIVGSSTTPSGWTLRLNNSGNLILTNGNTTYTSSSTVPINSWSHVAVARNGTSLSFFINGIIAGTSSSSDSMDLTSGTFQIAKGFSVDGANSYFTGSISNLRIIKGTALYTSTFVPPTSPLTAVSGTSLLTLQNATIIDNSTNAFTITNNGSVATSANSSVFVNAPVLCADQGPAGNNWTPNNISTASGSTYDSMTDVPTLTSATVANYCVINPLDKGANVTVTNGNLTYSVGATNMWRGSIQLPNTGKWYWECTQTSSNAEQFGIATATASTGTYLGGDANGWSYGGSGNKFNNNTSTAYGASFTNGDVIGVAFNADAGTLTFYKNNTSQGTAFSSLTGNYFPAGGGNLSSATVNFGQQPFVYTPPSGFVALNTYNL